MVQLWKNCNSQFSAIYCRQILLWDKETTSGDVLTLMSSPSLIQAPGLYSACIALVNKILQSTLWYGLKSPPIRMNKRSECCFTPTAWVTPSVQINYSNPKNMLCFLMIIQSLFRISDLLFRPELSYSDHSDLLFKFLEYCWGQTLVWSTHYQGSSSGCYHTKIENLNPGPRKVILSFKFGFKVVLVFKSIVIEWHIMHER
jgi:hypothetical protein